MNSLLFILANGCRRCDLPRGPRWASKSSKRRRLKAWHLDGALNELKAMILGIAGTRRMICWNSEDADGSFPHEKGGGSGVEYGCKGEVVLIHLIVDAFGMMQMNESRSSLCLTELKLKQKEPADLRRR
ncbi:MAG: hypothetical protein ACTFAL_14945 [Candidatus Electronema sp. V4]|uniref:hypothetical protein n=1 Tax=Candidatus Electronema sp. V4 TaxID=3454756 RepID=UPI0040554EAE